MHTLLSGPSRAGWKHVGVYPHHGIQLALSSLRSQTSCGIGEFYDLLPLLSWCAQAGLDILQLLPLNDSGQDPSPYNIRSSCALNFVYLSLLHLPNISHHPDLLAKLPSMRALSHLNRLDYAQVRREKLLWLHLYVTREKQTLLTSAKQFLDDHPWVHTYALFVASQEDVYTDPLFYSLLQYLCLQQMLHVKKHAHKEGVFLLGDLPILLSSDSSEVWAHPECFDQMRVAGAPPDAYNPEGQYWGLPLLHWDVLRKENFSWWKRRFAYATKLYDLYRIDHVFGLFRIFAIPFGASSQEGCFLPQNPLHWEQQGRELLQVILQASSLLPIAEDLGATVEMVTRVLQEMGICGMRVARWCKKEDYTPLSVTTLATHDLEPLALWWRNFPEEASTYCSAHDIPYTPFLSNPLRKLILHKSHQTPSLFHINPLQEYLALFPNLVWDTPEEERMNIPGTVQKSNWTYRFRPFIEEIIAHPSLTQEIRACIQQKP